MRRHAALVALFFMLVLWVWLFYAEGAIKGGANGKAFGADFAMFIGAGKVVHDGGNPYDHALLYRTEWDLLNRQHLPITRLRPVVRVGNPPLFFWALSPLTSLPFQTVAQVWIILLYALSIIAFYALLRHLGWRHRVVPVLFFMLMPQTILGPFYGNVIALVFVGIAFAVVLVTRHPLLAGVLLSISWMKPPVALPVAMLIVLFHTRNRWALLQGFILSSAVLLALTLAATGWQSLTEWMQGLLSYSRDMAIQPDVASFAGLYIRDVSHGVRLSIEALSLVIALVCTALAWRRHRDLNSVPLLTVGWLWALWFLATPYAHFFDEIVLVIPVLALLGKDACNVMSRQSIACLYLAFASLLLISAVPAGVQLLWLPLATILLLLYLGGRSAQPKDVPLAVVVA